MKTAKHGLTAALLGCALGAMAPCYGQTGGTSGPWMGGRMDTSLYLGANVGQSRFRTSCDGVPVSCDDKDVGWRLYAGYQFHPNFAVEGGYFHLGEASASGGGISAEAKARGLELLGVAIWPVMDQLSLFAKAGVARTRVSVSGGGFGFTASAKDNSTDFTFGLGAQYLFTRNFGARLEWQRYDNVGGSNTGKDDIDLFSLGALYRF